MSFLQIIILSLALAADAFTVGATVGLRHCRVRQIFRLAFHFGLFQSLFSLAGAIAGSLILNWIRDFDHWVVCGVLSAIGLRMIYLAWKDEDEHLADVDLTKGMSLVGLSTAVSIDAAAAGIGLPAAGASLAVAIPTIGLVSAAATLIAMRLADYVYRYAGKKCEIIAGLVLIGLGIYTPLLHLGIIH